MKGKYFVCVLIGLVIFINAGIAQTFDPDKPMIGIFEISVDTANAEMQDTDKSHHNMLYEEAGWVFIPNNKYLHNGKSHGIYVVQIYGGWFTAFDARCPRCFYGFGDNEGTIEVPGGIFGVCNKCGARADNMMLTGRGQMSFYEGDIDEFYYLTTYDVEVIKNGRKKTLRIKNYSNGMYDQWKALPENRIILDKAFDRHYYY